MGINGLKKFLESLSIPRKIHLETFKGTTIVIDGSALSKLITNHGKFKDLRVIPLIYSGQWTDIAFNVEVLLSKLSKYSIKPVVIFDGFDEDIKKQHLSERHNQQKERTIGCIEKIRRSEQPGEFTTPPHGWRTILQGILRNLNVEVIQAPFEADLQIIRYCQNSENKNIFGVLTSDYDFCILPFVNHFLNMDDWKVDDDVIECIDRKEQLEKFGITEKLLPLFGTILSKDFSTKEQRDNMNNYIKSQLGEREYIKFNDKGDRDFAEESSFWIICVLEWIQNELKKENFKVENLINDLEKVFPDVKNVYSKYLDFEQQNFEINFNHLIIDRLACSGLSVPSEVQQSYLEGKLSSSDLDYFMNEVTTGRGKPIFR